MEQDPYIKELNRVEINPFYSKMDRQDNIDAQLKGEINNIEVPYDSS